jgi:hypothetical protein
LVRIVVLSLMVLGTLASLVGIDTIAKFLAI